MQLFCKSCEAAFAGTTRCPRCGNRLLSPQESFIFSGQAGEPLPEPARGTAAGRAGIGLALGLAFTFGLRELATGLAGVSQLAAFEAWLVRLAGAAFGGWVAAAGWNTPATTGAVVGTGLAALAGLADWADAGKFVVEDAAMLVALPALAAAAGWVSGRLWPAPADLPEISLPTVSSHGSSLARLAEEENLGRKARPTNWVRVLLGATLALAATVASDQVRNALARGSEGAIQTGGAMRGPVIGVEIAAIAMLFGGFLAGATTGAGTRHGILVGILCTVGVFITAMNRADKTLPPAQGVFQVFVLEPDPLNTPRGAAYVLTPYFGLAVFAGWLGGQMFPPLAPKWRRIRRLPSQS